MFNEFPQSDFQIIAPGGESKGSVKGIYSKDKIVIPDATAPIAVGDELRRTIPSGAEETFEVIDPVYHQGFGGIPSHFQVAIRRKGAFDPGKGGNYTINVSGSNSRVNIGSTDNSTNTHTDNRVFTDLRTAISAQVSDPSERKLLLRGVDDMESNAGDKAGFAGAYQRFISSAADHMTVISPFLPALATVFG